jgi:hypothetical protein
MPKTIMTLPGATREFLETVVTKIKNMDTNDTLILDYTPTILEIGDAKILTDEEAKLWCKSHGLEVKERVTT